MSEQPTGDREAVTIGEQLPTIEAIASLARMFHALPGVYVTLHQVFANRFDLQAETPADFEVWREALQVPSAVVDLHYYAGGSWLAVKTVFHGAELHLTTHGLLADPQLAAVSPQEDAERRVVVVVSDDTIRQAENLMALNIADREDAERRAAALVEQRHQIEDPAVPPLAAAGPVAPIAVRTLADAQGGTA